jgi:bile acid:Na+ symporter, BASS family
MSGTPLVTQFLIGALALVMFGLGLSLTTRDFSRLVDHPKAVLVALGLQVVVLPACCYLLIVAFGLPPVFAVGMMLLAASPGGISANLFSHLFGGNVAMNISLTAINTVLSIATLPLIANWAIAHFAKTGQVVPLQFQKVTEVIAIVLLPVLIGMAVHRWRRDFAMRAEKPMKIFSALVLAVVALGALAKEWSSLTEHFAVLGPVVIGFNVLSLLSGYYLSRAAGLDKPMSTAISYEIGIHNSTLAIFIALAVLNDGRLALPAAVYSVSMYFTAVLFGFLALRAKR